MLKSSRARTFAPIPAETEKVGKLVLDCAYKVHTTLGPGLLESVYESCLRLDLLVAKCVIVEVKSVENLNQVYEAQLLTCLRLTGVRLGFLINFNVLRLKEDIKRLVV
jgi:hypothetical protein